MSTQPLLLLIPGAVGDKGADVSATELGTPVDAPGAGRGASASDARRGGCTPGISEAALTGVESCRCL